MHAFRQLLRCLPAVLALAAGGLGPALADDADTCAEESGEEALAACDRVIASGTIRGADLAELYYYRGFERLAGEDPTGAIADFEESLRIDPDHANIFALLGHAYRANGDLDQAISSYGEAISRAENNPNLYLFRGDARREKGDLPLAVADYDEAIALDPQEAEFLNARGIAAAASGDFELAVDAYSLAIELQPDLAVAYSNRGDAHRLLDDIGQAIADYGNAIANGPDDPVSVYKRGNAYRTERNFDAALADYSKLIELAPREADGYYERGVTYILKREFDLAISDLDKALETNPAHVLAYHARGLAHAAKKDFDKAIADYSEAILLDPDNAERFIVRAWTSFLVGKLDLALADADTAVDLDADLVAAYATRAKILEAMGKTEDAEADRIAEDAAQSRRSERRGAEAAVAGRARADALEARRGAEKNFLAAYEADRPYVYPVERAATALGHHVEDDSVVRYSDELTETGRRLLVDFQRANRLLPTGYLDKLTYSRLLDQPVDPNLFDVDTGFPDTAEPVGDWFFGADDKWCVIWTKPQEIEGIFDPNFTRVPVISISRFRDAEGDSISQSYADADLYEESAAVVIHGNRFVETENFGGDFGPVRSCDGDSCTAANDVLREFRAVNSFEVIGPSRVGGKDLIMRFSGVGFVKSFQRMDQECGNGRLGNWLR